MYETFFTHTHTLGILFWHRFSASGTNSFIHIVFIVRLTLWAEVDLIRLVRAYYLDYRLYYTRAFGACQGVKMVSLHLD